MDYIAVLRVPSRRFPVPVRESNCRMSLDQRGVAQEAADRPDVALSLTVVRYADGPDRCTIYPPETNGDARMSTWLSADYGAFVDLASMQ